MARKMLKKLMVLGIVGCMAIAPVSGVYAAEEKSVETLESENEALETRVAELESENQDLKDQLAAYENAETETEPSTEVVGTVYTDASIVKVVQQALNDAGYNCGTPDGQAGSKTAEAIRAYEKEKGINVNGVITDELLEALDVADEIEEAAKKEAQMKEYSSDYTYTQIARNPDSFKDTKMKFRGKVLQEGDAGSGIRYIRLAANSDYDSVLFITYNSDIVSMKILDDDIITIYGVCEGDYTYETVMGASITIPWIHAEIIDMGEVSSQ